MMENSSRESSQKGIFGRLRESLSRSLSNSIDRFRCCGQKRKNPVMEYRILRPNILKSRL